MFGPPRLPVPAQPSDELPPDLRVLVVEDDDAIREGIVDALEFEGYDALERADGREGLEAAVRSLRPEDRLVEIHWPDAVLAFGLSDPRGIVEVDDFEIDGQPAQPQPGTTLGELLPRGFHVAVASAGAEKLEFRLPMVIRGSGSTLQDWHNLAARSYAPRRLSFAIPNEARDLPAQLQQRKPEGDTVAYICSGLSCGAPLQEIAAFTHQLSQTEPQENP